jgi:tRNA (cytosine38-C5)-methyltransferase
VSSDKKLGTIAEYVTPEGDDPQYLVPTKYLTEYINYRHDITWPASSRSTTFTKAYGSKYIIGTGSFLQTKNLVLEYRNDDPKALVTLGLRFFTPMEIAKLHGLPIAEGEGKRIFKFAPSTTKAQQYKLLGNSLNIKVVSTILRYMFRNE